MDVNKVLKKTTSAVILEPMHLIVFMNITENKQVFSKIYILPNFFYAK